MYDAEIALLLQKTQDKYFKKTHKNAANSAGGPACNNAAPKVPPAVLHDVLPKARPAMLPCVFAAFLNACLLYLPWAFCSNNAKYASYILTVCLLAWPNGVRLSRRMARLEGRVVGGSNPPGDHLPHCPPTPRGQWGK